MSIPINEGKPMEINGTKGWGIRDSEGAEVWDARPVVDKSGLKSWLKLLFYPKKFALYRYLSKGLPNHARVLDVGAGTGAALIEMKKLFPQISKAVGLDVVQLEVDIANTRFEEYEVEASIRLYDGITLPFSDNYFDVIHTSDVLGHVQNVPAWLRELNRVLKPGGRLVMFSESKLGKHAYIRNYLLAHGINTDPHAEFHISLYSKTGLRELLIGAGFTIDHMYSAVWAKFLVHPDELYSALQKAGPRFPILRAMNSALFWLKEKTKPFSLAVAEFYCLVEMYTLGRFVESQGYVILAKKK